jgi:hypothetical protein
VTRTHQAAARHPRLPFCAVARLAVVGVVALAGCADDGPNVASLAASTPSGQATETQQTSVSEEPSASQQPGEGDPTGATSPTGDTADDEADSSAQSDAAAALETCLISAGLPAYVEWWDDGTGELEWYEGYQILARDREGKDTSIDASEVDDDVRAAFWEGKVDSDTGQELPGLWIDGVDHTEVWVKCLDESGYVHPEAPDPSAGIDLIAQMRESQRYADSTNAWIACARDHGLPDLDDITVDRANPIIDAVELPLSTDPESLRTLLKACPVFDGEQARRRMDPSFDPLTDVPEPMVVVEWTDADKDSPEYKRMRELAMILGEANDAFWEKIANEGASAD